VKASIVHLAHFFLPDMQNFYTSSLKKNHNALNCVHNSLPMKPNFFNVSYPTSPSTLCRQRATVKQKWERIVNCGFDKTNSQDDNLTSPTATNQGGVVLEGIKEGVQGVSRFIAAGLGEFSSSALSSPSRKHVVHQSCSSISTYATKSTRFSQSSASSLGDDPHSLPDSPSKEHVQVLMVHDTGATPTMSPNFTFAHQQQEMKTQQEHPDGGFESDAGSEREAKLQRRKSREGTTSRLPSRTTVSNSNDFVRGDVANRTRVYGNKSAGLPPASSIPGLGSLAVGAPAPSWVESVGRRWEELQKGSTCVVLFFLLYYHLSLTAFVRPCSFSKNQKRASLLLSDVSQTIVLALSSPPFPTPPSSNPQTSQSLLDDDDNPLDSMTSVLKPDLSATHSTSEARGGSLSPQDFDEDWNW
jgi:hypothetical protein